jgi:hypothetical protein
MKPKPHLFTLLSAMVLLAFAGTARAAEHIYWQNPAGGDWAEAANWGGTLPAPEDWATIVNVPGSGWDPDSASVGIDTNETVEKLELDSSYLRISDSGSLSVSDLTLTNTQTTAAELSINGSLNATTITLGVTSGGDNFGEGNV